jgi:putative NADH-flavin reductase
MSTPITMKNILIFGASGLTGQLLTKMALEDGHRVTAFVRTPKKFKIQHPHLTVVEGNVTQAEVVAQAVANQDIVLCALGAKSPFVNDPKLVEGIRNIVHAMETHFVKRLVYLSVIGADGTRFGLGTLAKIFMPLVLGKVIQDHHTKEQIIANSNLEWTFVRAPKLTNGRYTGSYRVGEKIATQWIIPQISRKDLAEFMYNESQRNQFIKQKPRIMY